MRTLNRTFCSLVGIKTNQLECCAEAAWWRGGGAKLHTLCAYMHKGSRGISLLPVIRVSPPAELRKIEELITSTVSSGLPSFTIYWLKRSGSACIYLWRGIAFDGRLHHSLIFLYSYGSVVLIFQRIRYDKWIGLPHFPRVELQA